MNNIKHHNHRNFIRSGCGFNKLNDLFSDKETLTESDYFNVIFLKEFDDCSIVSYAKNSNYNRYTYTSNGVMYTVPKSVHYKLYIDYNLYNILLSSDLINIQRLMIDLSYFIEHNFKKSLKFNKELLYTTNKDYIKLYNYLKSNSYLNDHLNIASKCVLYDKYAHSTDEPIYSYNNQKKIFEIIDLKQFKNDLNLFFNKLNRLYLFALSIPEEITTTAIRDFVKSVVNSVNECNQINKELTLDDITNITYYYEDIYPNNSYDSDKRICLSKNRRENLYGTEMIKTLNEAIDIVKTDSNTEDSFETELNFFTYMIINSILSVYSTEGLKYNINNGITFNVYNMAFNHFKSYVEGFDDSYVHRCSLISIENKVKSFIVLPYQCRGDKMNIIYASSPNRRNTIKKAYRYKDSRSADIIDSNYNSDSKLIDESNKDDYGASYFGNADDFLTELSFMEGNSFKNRYVKYFTYDYQNDSLNYDHMLEFYNLFDSKVLISNRL